MTEQTRFLTVFLCVTPLIISGCKSAEEEKAGAAIARAQNRKMPGFARVLNLSSSPVKFLHKGRILTQDIAPEGASKFVPVALESQTLTIKTGSSELSAKVNFVSGEGITVIVLPDGKQTAIVDGLRRYPTDSANTQVKFITLTPGGTDLSASVTLDGPTPSTAKGPSTDLKLNPGEYKVSGSGVTGEPFEVKAEFSYSVLVVGTSKAAKAYGLVNSPTEKPIAAGQSAS